MCDDLNCTCYAEGLVDGAAVGFYLGCRLTYRAAYVKGYLDASAGKPPLPAYEQEINALLPLARRTRTFGITPTYLSLPCGCYDYCTCRMPAFRASTFTLAPAIPVEEENSGVTPWTLLSCGCYGTCPYSEWAKHP
jgi:hypothetical protein